MATTARPRMLEFTEQVDALMEAILRANATGEEAIGELMVKLSDALMEVLQRRTNAVGPAIVSRAQQTGLFEELKKTASLYFGRSTNVYGATLERQLDDLTEGWPVVYRPLGRVVMRRILAADNALSTNRDALLTEGLQSWRREFSSIGSGLLRDLQRVLRRARANPGYDQTRMVSDLLKSNNFRHKNLPEIQPNFTLRTRAKAIVRTELTVQRQAATESWVNGLRQPGDPEPLYANANGEPVAKECIKANSENPQTLEDWSKWRLPFDKTKGGIPPRHPNCDSTLFWVPDGYAGEFVHMRKQAYLEKLKASTAEKKLKKAEEKAIKAMQAEERRRAVGGKTAAQKEAEAVAAARRGAFYEDQELAGQELLGKEGPRHWLFEPGEIRTSIRDADEIEESNVWVRRRGSYEKDLIYAYTGDYYAAINEAARDNPLPVDPYTNPEGGIPLNRNYPEKESPEQISRDLWNLLDRAPEPERPVTVWRSLDVTRSRSLGGGATSSAEWVESGTLSPGDVLTMEGFKSATVNPGMAANWKSDKDSIIWEIKTRRGAFVDSESANAGELEWLIPPGWEFRVLGISREQIETRAGIVERWIVRIEDAE